jgi:DNA primase
MGSRLSDAQYILLQRLDCTYYLMLDNDDAGQKCTKEIISKFRGISTLKQVIYDKHQPDDLIPEELYKAILKAKKI